MIAPELVFSKALCDMLAAKDIAKETQIFAAQDGHTWTHTHSLFANMGGFVIEYGEENPTTPTMSPTSEDHNPNNHLVNMSGGHRSGEVSAPQPSFGQQELPLDPAKYWTTETREKAKVFMQDRSTQRNFVHLTAEEVLNLRRANVIDKVPAITKEEINDKSTSDDFTKGVAVGQIVWTVIQTCVRSHRGLPISQLELAVAAFSVCAVAIYGINWKKPKGVKVPYVLLRHRAAIPDNVLEQLVMWSVESLLKAFFSIFLSCASTVPEERLSSSAIPNDSLFLDDVNGHRCFMGTLVATGAFGAPHVVAWDFAFPTRIEQSLWRLASIYTTICLSVMPAPACIIGAFGECIKEIYMVENPLERLAMFVLFYVAPIIYIIARLYILVETFRTLCFLPPGAYVSTWTTNIPHFG